VAADQELAEAGLRPPPARYNSRRLKDHRTPLVFAHANGFPAPCYATLSPRWKDSFAIRYLPRLGHQVEYPVTDGWPELTRELIAFIEQGPHPVVAVGHSFGGFLSFMAAAQRPDLFSALIPAGFPDLRPLKARALEMSKTLRFRRSGSRRRAPRAAAASTGRTRRRRWRTSVRASCSAISRRNAWPDYVRYGTIEDPQAGGRVLWIDPAIEYQIYCTVPHHMHQVAAPPAGCPPLSSAAATRTR